MDCPILKNGLVPFASINNWSFVPNDIEACVEERAKLELDEVYEYSKSLKERGIEVVIAGAGGAAHLPGMLAALTIIPVLGVPIETKSLKGLDSLLSIVQMPAGIPLPTLAIGKAGSINAALSSVSILSNKYPKIREKLEKYRKKQTNSIKKIPTNEK